MSTHRTRTRDGELVELDDDDQVTTDTGATSHDDTCTGWAGDDNDGRPIPCPTCKPDTVARLQRQRRRLKDRP